MLELIIEELVGVSGKGHVCLLVVGHDYLEYVYFPSLHWQPEVTLAAPDI